MDGYDELNTVLVNVMPSPVGGRGWPCGEDPDLWFSEQPAEVETAKRICRSCPVRRRCLAGALARREPWGVWGGELVVRGQVVARKRGRGRPRKDAEAA